jgi:hypothetical protein
LEIDDNSDFSSLEAVEVGIMDFPEETASPKFSSAIAGIQIQDLSDIANLQDNIVYYWEVKAVAKFGGNYTPLSFFRW